MKHLLIYVLVILFACNDKKMSIKNLPSKGRSSIIVKDGSFIGLKLNVRPFSRDTIFADLSVTNNSEDSIPFYKSLLPSTGELKTNIFSIFENENLNQIKYTGFRDEQYLNTGSDVIIPKLRADNFITILSKQTRSYTINLSKFYDFSMIDTHKSLSLTYANFLPAISSEYKQIFERDTVDGQMKPVYYDLTLPKKQSVDSMRVQFKLFQAKTPA